MRIRYTQHARLRMSQRRISEVQVSETLLSPDQLLEGEQGEMIAVKYYGVRELRVVFLDVDEITIKVITVIKTGIKSNG